MTHNIYFNDSANGVRHATFVHQGGHTIIRDIPEDSVEALRDQVREFRNSLPSADVITEQQVHEFFLDLGFEYDENFNPPITAFRYSQEYPAEPDSIKSMKVAGLRALATDLGLEIEGLKRPELIAAIEAKMAEAGA